MPRRPIPTFPRQTSRAIVRRGQMITYPGKGTGPVVPRVRVDRAEVRGDRPWKIIVIYTERVYSPIGNYAPGFSVTVNGQPRSVVGGQGSSVNETYVDVDPFIEAGDEVLLSYDDTVGDISAFADDEPVPSFTDLPVQNIIGPGGDPRFWFQYNQGLNAAGNLVESWASQTQAALLLGDGPDGGPVLEPDGTIFFPPDQRTGLKEQGQTFFNATWTQYMLMETPSAPWSFNNIQMMADRDGASPSSGFGYRWAQQELVLWAGNSSGNNPISVAPGTWIVATCKVVGNGTDELRVDANPGQLQTNISSRDNFFGMNVFRGGTDTDTQPWANGRIKEYMVYQADHDTATQDQVIAYLQAVQASAINDFVTYSGVQLFSGPTPVWI